MFECHPEEDVEPGWGAALVGAAVASDTAQMNGESGGDREEGGYTSRCCRTFNNSPVRLMKRQTLFITTYTRAQTETPVGLITQTPPQ